MSNLLKRIKWIIGILSKFCGDIFRYYPITMGISSYWHDEKNGVYKHNMLSRIVAVLAKIIGIYVYCLMIPTKAKLENPLTALTLSWQSGLETSELLILSLLIWYFDTDLGKLKTKMIALEKSVKIKIISSTEIETKFKYICQIKWFAICFTYIITLLSIAVSHNTIIAIPLANKETLKYFVIFQYFEMAAEICRQFYYIDQRIRNIAKEVDEYSIGFETPDNFEFRISSEIVWLRRQHSMLCSQLEELQRIFKLQLFVNRQSAIFVNALSFYKIYVEYVIDELPWLKIFAYTVLVFIVFLDLYTNDYMGEMMSQSLADVELTLKDFDATRRCWSTIDEQVKF